MTHPALLWYGDDFTGATDTLGTAARAGLRALLFLRLPTDAQRAAAGPLDCVGLAGAARSMGPDALRAELSPVVPLFRQLGARVLHYKVCSTFDSAPEVGSIGLALQVLRAGLPDGRTAIVGGQPDLGRYCVFGNLFARAGSAGEVHRIDRHPTMARHPVTPMGEADLRRHLAQQGLDRLGLLSYSILRGSPEALRAHWQALADSAPDGVLFDVADNSDLDSIGSLLWQEADRAPLLVAGASSVVQAIAPFIASPGSKQAVALVAPARGPVFVLAGSLSPVTAEQVRNASSYEIIWLDPQALVDQAEYGASAAQRIIDLLRADIHVLACTAVPGRAAPKTVDSLRLALAGGALLREVLHAVPLSRVGVAGGDTSSHAVQALDAWGLSYLALVAPGVALCRLHSDNQALNGTEIALKGGQMGARDFFERLVQGHAKG